MTKYVNVCKYSSSKVSITAILTPSGGRPIDVDVIDINMEGMFVRTNEKPAPEINCLSVKMEPS